jgi:hypothetical protein
LGEPLNTVCTLALHEDKRIGKRLHVVGYLRQATAAAVHYAPRHDTAILSRKKHGLHIALERKQPKSLSQLRVVCQRFNNTSEWHIRCGVVCILQVTRSLWR